MSESTGIQSTDVRNLHFFKKFFFRERREENEEKANYAQNIDLRLSRMLNENAKMKFN